MEQRYGIKDAHVAGCIVAKSMEGATDTFYSAMRQLLTEKYGCDIFKEAEEMSAHTEPDSGPSGQ